MPTNNKLSAGRLILKATCIGLIVGAMLGTALFGLIGGLIGTIIGCASGLCVAALLAVHCVKGALFFKSKNFICPNNGCRVDATIITDDSNAVVDIDSCTWFSPASNIKCKKKCINHFNDGSLNKE